MDIQCREKSAITKTYSAFEMDVLSMEYSCRPDCLSNHQTLIRAHVGKNKIACYLFGFDPWLFSPCLVNWRKGSLSGHVEEKHLCNWLGKYFSHFSSLTSWKISRGLFLSTILLQCGLGHNIQCHQFNFNLNHWILKSVNMFIIYIYIYI